MKIFDYGKVKDPQYFRDGNWISPCSDHLYYASEGEWMDGCPSFTESLNGLWKFHYAKNYESVIPGFEKEDYNPVSLGGPGGYQTRRDSGVL